VSAATPATPVEFVDRLEVLRTQLATLEAQRHSTRINAFMRSSEPTVQGRTNEGEWATLDLNEEILRHRAEIATLEDRLKVALHGLEA